jgi:hypothetical protein
MCDVPSTAVFCSESTECFPIIIIIIIISFMQGIYTSIPETNHVPRESSVAAIIIIIIIIIIITIIIII